LGFFSGKSRPYLERILNQSTHGSETTTNLYFTGFRRSLRFSDTIWTLRPLTLRSGSGSLPDAEDWVYRRSGSPSFSGSMTRR
jgi:hypothetical protein